MCLNSQGRTKYFNDIREHFYLGNDFKQSLDALRRLYSNANEYDLKLTYTWFFENRATKKCQSLALIVNLMALVT